MRTWPVRIGLIALMAFLILGNNLGCGDKRDKADEMDRVKGGKDKGGYSGNKGGDKDKDKKAGLRESLEDKNVNPGKEPAKPVVRRIIYTATLKLQVDDFPKAEDALLQLIDEYHGILGQSEFPVRAAVPGWAGGKFAWLPNGWRPFGKRSSSWANRTRIIWTARM